jgi:hypothetical protein
VGARGVVDAVLAAARRAAFQVQNCAIMRG